MECLDSQSGILSHVERSESQNPGDGGMVSHSEMFSTQEIFGSEWEFRVTGTCSCHTDLLRVTRSHSRVLGNI